MTRSRQTADWGSRAGLAKVIPSSVAVGSGTGSADSLGTVTFSGASSVSLNGCFTSTYVNYKVLVTGFTSSATANHGLRLRVSGTDNSSDYNFSGITMALGGTTVTGTSNNSSTTSWYIGSTQSAYAINNFELDFLRPQEANFTSLFSRATGTNSGGSFSSYTTLGVHYVATAYDGFTILANTGTISGTVRVYGYN